MVINANERIDYEFDAALFRQDVEVAMKKHGNYIPDVSPNIWTKIADEDTDRLMLNEVMKVCQHYSLDLNKYLRRRVWRLVTENEDAQ